MYNAPPARSRMVIRPSRTGGSAAELDVLGALELGLGGGRRQVRRLGAGELFGELGVLLGRTRTATVTAARPATAIELPADDFRQAIALNPLALEQVSSLIAGRLIATTRGDRTNNT